VIAPENRTAAGTFKPGVSGNPGGRPKRLASMIREKMPAEQYVELMLLLATTATSARDRIAALRDLADRGYGKAPIFAAVEGMDPLELDEVASEIQRIADDLRAKREAKGLETAPQSEAA